MLANETTGEQWDSIGRAFTAGATYARVCPDGNVERAAGRYGLCAGHFAAGFYDELKREDDRRKADIGANGTAPQYH